MNEKIGREDLLAVNVVPVQRTTTWLGRLKEKEVSHPVSVTPGEGREAEQSATDTADEVRVHPVTQNPLKDVLGVGVCIIMQSDLSRYICNDHKIEHFQFPKLFKSL